MYLVMDMRVVIIPAVCMRGAMKIVDIFCSLEAGRGSLSQKSLLSKSIVTSMG